MQRGWEQKFNLFLLHPSCRCLSVSAESPLPVPFQIDIMRVLLCQSPVLFCSSEHSIKHFIECKSCCIKIAAVVNEIYNLIKSIGLVGQELFIFHMWRCFPLYLLNPVLNPSRSANFPQTDIWLKCLMWPDHFHPSISSGSGFAVLFRGNQSSTCQLGRYSSYEQGASPPSLPHDPRPFISSTNRGKSHSVCWRPG